MISVHRAKLYFVGSKPDWLPPTLNEVGFEGDTVRDLLKSIGKERGKTLLDEIVAEDGSYRHGFALAVNGEIVRTDQLSDPIPNLSDVVVIHLLQIPAGG